MGKAARLARAQQAQASGRLVAVSLPGGVLRLRYRATSEPVVDTIERLAAWLAQAIVAWDLTDQGRPVAITPASLAGLGGGVLLRLALAMRNDARALLRGSPSFTSAGPPNGGARDRAQAVPAATHHIRRA
jgi:surfactin synthase thioesterase subunit